jgi:ABC-type branched-subunit amino acid transport system permease subunit
MLLGGAFAGALSLAASYALARRIGLTRIDLADRLLPDRPLLGRSAQIAAGTAACLPASYTAAPALGLLAGGAAGAVAATTAERRSDRALAVATHALAGLVAAWVSRAAHARR